MAALKVGLAVGRGTGPELARVFERVLSHLADIYSVPVQVVRSPRLYHTYFSLDGLWIVLMDVRPHILTNASRPSKNEPVRLQYESGQDVEAYESFCEQLVREGSRVMFKTAINAQSLYLIRQHQQAVKVELFTQGPNALLLIRDQAQGFYTGSNGHNMEHNSVSKCSSFDKRLTGRIVAWSLQRAEETWGLGAINSVLMVYKFHLLDGIMSAWADEWSLQYGMEITFVQPDTANRNLLAHGIRGRQLMIAGNEWADIMHIMLLDRLGHGAPELSCTENVYVRDDLKGLTEYQTTHGSADDIGGHGVVNPSATIRAAAKILARHAGTKGVVERMDTVLLELARRKATTKDQGGCLGTDAVVDQVIGNFGKDSTKPETGNEGLPPNLCAGRFDKDPFSQGKPTAVVIMDFQNDFVSAKGTGAHYRGDMTRMAGPAANVSRIISYSRTENHTVIFVRFLGNQEYQLENWQDRDRSLGKESKCISGRLAMYPSLGACATLLVGLRENAFFLPGDAGNASLARQQHVLAQVLASFVVLYTLANASIKLSILAYYRRVFVGRVVTICIWCLILATFLWLIYGLLAWILYCGTNVRENFNGPWEDCPLWGVDIEQAVFVWDSVIDLAILILPMPIVFRLQVPVKRKLLVAVLFLVGGLAIVAGLNNTVVQLIYLVDPNNTGVEGASPDLNQGGDLILSNWPAIEIGVGLIACNLPSITMNTTRALSAWLLAGWRDLSNTITRRSSSAHSAGIQSVELPQNSSISSKQRKSKDGSLTGNSAGLPAIPLRVLSKARASGLKTNN